MCSHATDSSGHRTEKEQSTTVWAMTVQHQSKIVLVNSRLLGLVKHNPDPTVKPGKEAIQRLGNISLVPQRLLWNLIERQKTIDQKTTGNPMYILVLDDCS